MSTLEKLPAAGRALAGVARRDITPPVGIYARLWGAAKHDQSEGTHRPLSTTALAIRSTTDDQPAVLLSIDSGCIGDLAGGEDNWLRASVREALGIDDAHLMVACTHTHGSPWPARSRAELPGGDMIEPYLEQMREAVLQAAREAIATAVPATLTFDTGKCSLATCRDLPDPDPQRDRYVTGFNPDVPADDTVVVGRVTRDSDNKIIGTVVNYACHPTTLAWDNKLVSPDYIGAMREVVEAHTDGAPCLFVQGASGELAPAHQYVGDHSVPDQHGRRLGFAALSTLEGMLAPGHKLVYEGVMESGAPLAVWRPHAYDVSTVLDVHSKTVGLPTKDWPSADELEKQIEQATDRFAQERLFRKLQMVRVMDDTGKMPSTVYVWRIGGAMLVGHQNEAYSVWQQSIRGAFPDYTVVAMNCVNYAAVGYLVPDELHEVDLYTAWQPPFGKGGLKMLTDTSIELMQTAAKD